MYRRSRPTAADFFRFLCVSVVSSLCTISGITPSVSAQSIVPDATLGAEGSLVLPIGESLDAIQGGALRGTNLFHSFEKFGIDPNAVALFLVNSSSIENIFSRVTGDLPSNLSGVLSTKVSSGSGLLESSADFYLINPNGILFGNGAALDIGGSFIGTTASSIEFDEIGAFSAIASSSPEQLLTVKPSAYLFETSEIGDIKGTGNQDATLLVRNGESITLIGGGILLPEDNNTQFNLLAPGGRINIGSVGEPDSVSIAEDGSLQFSTNRVRGNISLGFGAFSTQLPATDLSRVGGAITLTGNNISLDNSTLATQANVGQGTSADTVGSIILNATGDVGLNNSALLSVSASDSRSGAIEIDARSLESLNTLLTTSALGEGDGGDLNITTRDEIILEDSQLITVLFEASTAERNGGDISISGERINIIEGSQLATSVSENGSGNAGDVFLNAEEDITIAGSNGQFITAIGTGISLNAVGNSGDIQITGRSLRVADGGNISASVLGKGDGGDIDIEIEEEIIFEGISLPFSTRDPSLDPVIGDLPVAPPSVRASSLISSTVALTGEGNGGDIRVSADAIRLLDGATFITGIFAAGESGDIFVSAADIELRGRNPEGSPSSLVTQADFGASGTGGDIEVKGDRIRLVGEDGDPTGPVFTASARGEGQAGNIRVNASESLYLRNAQIDTFSEQQSGGNIDITAERILLEGERGGNITTQVLAGEGTGGNINLNASSYIIAFDDTDILASSPEGTGGNIVLQTPAFFGENISINDQSAGTLLNILNNRVDVDATGRIDGSVSTPDVSLVENNVSELSEELVDTETLVANSCIVRSDDTAGQFTTTGREGASQDPSSEVFQTYTLSSIESVQPEQPITSIAEPSEVYHLSNGQRFLSRPCNIDSTNRDSQ